MKHLKDTPGAPPVQVFAGNAHHSLQKIIVVGDEQAARFVTPSGVTGIVATSISSDMLSWLRRRLEGKVRRAGLHPDASVSGQDAKGVIKT